MEWVKNHKWWIIGAVGIAVIIYLYFSGSGSSAASSDQPQFGGVELGTPTGSSLLRSLLTPIGTHAKKPHPVAKKPPAKKPAPKPAPKPPVKKPPVKKPGSNAGVYIPRPGGNVQPGYLHYSQP